MQPKGLSVRLAKLKSSRQAASSTLTDKTAKNFIFSAWFVTNFNEQNPLPGCGLESGNLGCMMRVLGGRDMDRIGQNHPP
jgi:hypothetical protein